MVLIREICDVFIGYYDNMRYFKGSFESVIAIASIIVAVFMLILFPVGISVLTFKVMASFYFLIRIVMSLIIAFLYYVLILSIVYDI